MSPIALMLACGVGLTGCEQAKKLAGGDEKGAEDKKAEEPDKAKEAEKAPEPVEPAPIIADKELPPLPEKVDPVDDLFHLVPKGEDGAYFIIRDPSAFITYAEQTFKIYEKPVERLAQAASSMGDTKDVDTARAGFAIGKAKFNEVAAKINESGIDMTHGFVMASTDGEMDDPIILYVAKEPDALKKLVLSLADNKSKAERMVCKEYKEVGHMGCADSQKILDAYKPDGDGPKHRKAAETALPGVKLDDANIIAHISEGKDGPIYLAVSTPPGTGIMHVSLPTGDRDLREALDALTPGKGSTLKFAQPGTGFFWMNLDFAKLRANEKELKDAPPPLDSVINSITGEFFVGGSAEPAGLQFHMGVSEPTAFEAALEIAMMATKDAPKSIPDIPGSQLKIERKELALAAGPAKALHVSVSGIPEASVIAEIANMKLEGWTYTSGGVASMAVGIDEEGVKALAATKGDGVPEMTTRTFPKALTESLAKGEVSFISHLPLDSLQGPKLREVMTAGLKKVPDVKPELANAVLDMIAPISSSTTWMTESDTHAVVHFAVRGIGNATTDEGKDAIAAMLRVMGGESRETVFREIAAKYPATSHSVAYQTRAGIGSQGAIAGSAVGLLAAGGAVGYALFTGGRNETLAEDAGVTIEEAKPEPEKPADKPKPKPEAKPDAKKDEAKKDEAAKDKEAEKAKEEAAKREEEEKKKKEAEEKKPTLRPGAPSK